MKKLLLLISLFAVSTQAAMSACPKANSTDLFEPKRDIIIDGEPQCLDTRARSLKILKPQEALAFTGSNSADHHYIANLHHLGQYWIAEIPKSALSQIIVQEEIFMDLWITKAAHTQIRFDFPEDAPVKLFAQSSIPQGTPKPKHLLFGFAVSFEALGYINGPAYDLLAGMGNPFVDGDADFHLVSRAISLTDTYKDFVVTKKHKVRQFLLKPTKIDYAKALETALVRSSNNFQMKQKYDLIYRNCTNVLFETIDEALSNERNILDRAVTAYPDLTIDALKARKIFSKELTRMDKESSPVVHSL